MITTMTMVAGTTMVALLGVLALPWTDAELDQTVDAVRAVAEIPDALVQHGPIARGRVSMGIGTR